MGESGAIPVIHQGSLTPESWRNLEVVRALCPKLANVILVQISMPQKRGFTAMAFDFRDFSVEKDMQGDGRFLKEIKDSQGNVCHKILHIMQMPRRESVHPAPSALPQKNQLKGKISVYLLTSGERMRDLQLKRAEFRRYA